MEFEAGVLNLVWEHLLPAMGDQPLSLDEQSYGTLLQTVAALEYPPIDFQTEDTLADRQQNANNVLLQVTLFLKLITLIHQTMYYL